MRRSQITDWCHEIIRTQGKHGGIYVDATMGNGNDTLFLCKLAGETGKVYAFDIQKKALDVTKQLLDSHQLSDRATLILDGHEHMGRYLERESVDVVCFNFGYLPGGDHRVCTQANTSLAAVKVALTLLKKGGMLCLCIYSGGDTGFEERDALLDFLGNLPPREYTVIMNQYHNRRNNPPLPVFVWKE